MEMNDFENEIFTNVATVLRENHTGVNVTGEYIRKPSKFPTATLEEIQNVTVDNLVDSTDIENYSGVGYRLQVFSNKRNGKKAEAKAIFKTADAEIRRLGFRRKTYTTTPEIYDSTIFSITATYEGVIDTNGYVYKR
jgi:hypothetical protein